MTMTRRCRQSETAQWTLAPRRRRDRGWFSSLAIPSDLGQIWYGPQFLTRPLREVWRVPARSRRVWRFLAGPRAPGSLKYRAAQMSTLLPRQDSNLEPAG